MSVIRYMWRQPRAMSTAYT